MYASDKRQRLKDTQNQTNKQTNKNKAPSPLNLPDFIDSKENDPFIQPSFLFLFLFFWLFVLCYVFFFFSKKHTQNQAHVQT